MRRNGGIVMASLAKGEGELEGLSDSRKKKPNPGVGGRRFSWFGEKKLGLGFCLSVLPSFSILKLLPPLCVV
jgi:hypothetical protein